MSDHVPGVGSPDQRGHDNAGREQNKNKIWQQPVGGLSSGKGDPVLCRNLAAVKMRVNAIGDKAYEQYQGGCDHNLVGSVDGGRVARQVGILMP